MNQPRRRKVSQDQKEYACSNCDYRKSESEMRYSYIPNLCPRCMFDTDFIPVIHPANDSDKKS